MYGGGRHLGIPFFIEKLRTRYDNGIQMDDGLPHGGGNKLFPLAAEVRIKTNIRKWQADLDGSVQRQTFPLGESVWLGMCCSVK